LSLAVGPATDLIIETPGGVLMAKGLNKRLGLPEVGVARWRSAFLGSGLLLTPLA